MIKRLLKPVFLVAAAALVGLIVYTIVLSPNRALTVTVLGEDSSNLAAIATEAITFTQQGNARIEVVRKSFEAAGQLANQDLAAGTGVFDIVLQYNFSLANFVRTGWVLTLDEMKALLPADQEYDFESDLFPRAWKEVGYYRVGAGMQSKVIPVGYPFATNTMLLVYNRTLFQKHDDEYSRTYGTSLKPPATWFEFKRIAEFMTRKDPVSGKATYGLVLNGATGGWLYYEWCNFAYSLGGGVMKKDYGWDGDRATPLTLNSKENIEATSFYRSLRPYAYGDFFATSATEAQEAMRTGRVAMAIIWSDYIPGLLSSVDDNSYGFAPIPGAKSMLAGGIYYVARKSPHRKEAAEFILWLMQRDVQKRLALAGLCSPLRTVYDDPDVAKLPYSTALRESLSRGVYMAEAGPDADLISEILTNYLQRILKDELSVEDGLRVAEEEINTRRTSLFNAMDRRTPER